MEALQEQMKMDVPTTNEVFDQFDTYSTLISHLEGLSEANYKGQQKRFDDWDTPEEVRVSTLSTIGRNVAEKLDVRVHIDSFEYRSNSLKPQMSIEDKARIILTHFKETIPGRLEELEEHTEQSIASLKKSLQFYQNQISPGDPSEQELKRGINNTQLEIEDLEKALQITQRIYDIKEYFHIHIRDNSHLNFNFSITESNTVVPRFKSQGPKKWSKTKFEEIFDPYYIGEEGNYRFTLKLIPLSSYPNVFLVGIKAPIGNKNLDNLLEAMFNPNTLDTYQVPQYRSLRREEREPIVYDILARHRREVPLHKGRSTSSRFQSAFYLIATESDRIPNRKNAFMQGVQLDIISSYQFCFKCHTNQHSTKRCPTFKAPVAKVPYFYQNESPNNARPYKQHQKDDDGFNPVTKGAPRRKESQPLISQHRQGGNRFAPLADLPESGVTEHVSHNQSAQPDSHQTMRAIMHPKSTGVPRNTSNNERPQDQIQREYIQDDDDETVRYTDSDEDEDIRDDEASVILSHQVQDQEMELLPETTINAAGNKPTRTQPLLQPITPRPRKQGKSLVTSKTKPLATPISSPSYSGRLAPLTRKQPTPYSPIIGLSHSNKSQTLRQSQRVHEALTKTLSLSRDESQAQNTSASRTPTLRDPPPITDPPARVMDITDSPLGSTLGEPESTILDNMERSDPSLRFQSQSVDPTQVDSPSIHQDIGDHTNLAHQPVTVTIGSHEANPSNTIDY
ncbi:hypothetical protein G9P44_005347 [Scheffersomyces stipitis]|nr:hypothetical protein G9P44_005347 [Scheffersomyces stipitis]